MNLNAVGIVYRKEFTEWVRDRRTLISTVLVPAFCVPLMMVGFSALAVVMVASGKGNAQDHDPGRRGLAALIASIKKLDSLEIVPMPQIGRTKFPTRIFGRRWKFPRDSRSLWKPVNPRR